MIQHWWIRLLILWITAYIYKLELYHNAAGNRFIGRDPGVASTPFLTPVPGDEKAILNLSLNVPWINTEYVIYRYNDLSTTWDSVGVSTMLIYTDTGLRMNRHIVIM